MAIISVLESCTVLNKEKIDIMFHHHPCPDGFGCKYLLLRYYKETNNTRPVQYVGVSYGSTLSVDVTDKNVIICDYTYPFAVMEKNKKIM